MSFSNGVLVYSSRGVVFLTPPYLPWVPLSGFFLRPVSGCFVIALSWRLAYVTLSPSLLWSFLRPNTSQWGRHVAFIAIVLSSLGRSSCLSYGWVGKVLSISRRGGVRCARVVRRPLLRELGSYPPAPCEAMTGLRAARHAGRHDNPELKVNPR